MDISELARRAGVAPSAVRFYEDAGVLPAARRRANGYRAYVDADLARLRLVVALRRLGLAPVDAGRLASLCIDRAEVDIDLASLIAAQRAAIERQRADLDRVDGELTDLELTIAAAGRARLIKETEMAADQIRVLFVCTGNSARSQIAEALHVSKPALYYHFKDKEELFLAILTMYLDEMEKAIDRIMAEPVACREKVRDFMEYVLAQPPDQRAIIHLASQEADALGGRRLAHERRKVRRQRGQRKLIDGAVAFEIPAKSEAGTELEEREGGQTGSR